MSRRARKSELLVSASPCEHCLFGAKPLVSPERKAELIAESIAADSYFICHVPALRKMEHDWTGTTQVACHAFFKRYQWDVLALRLASLLHIARYIDVQRPKQKE